MKIPIKDTPKEDKPKILAYICTHSISQLYKGRKRIVLKVSILKGSTVIMTFNPLLPWCSKIMPTQPYLDDSRVCGMMEGCGLVHILYVRTDMLGSEELQ